MADLEPWWKVCEPHVNIRKGEFPEQSFAIDLNRVLSKEGPEIYHDPNQFYKKTHITKVIKKTLVQALNNLSGEHTGNRVSRLQTGFGGGKSHILLTLYHFFNSPEALSDRDKAQKIVNESKVDSVPETNIAVIVGTEPDISGGETRGDVRIRTLWGELAYQLGGEDAYKIIEESDKNRISPGKGKLVELLKENQPALILIDELLHYVIKARSRSVGDSTLSAQTTAFFDELVRAVEGVENVFMAVSLQASERFETFDDPEIAQRLLNQLETKTKRMDTVTQPVKKSEIYHIARQRIFDEINDDSIAKQIAETYHDYYLKHSSSFPDKSQDIEYKNKIELSYPFHPELIDTLYTQWSTLPDFHRTRGVLRLLSKVISDLFDEQPDSLLIHPGHVNLADDEIRDEILDYLEEGWEGAIGADIAGESSKATEIDRQFGGIYQTKQLTQSLATSIFLYSISGGERTGATLEKLRLSVLQPDMETAFIANSLSECEKVFYYLEAKEGFYRFKKKPGINKVIEDHKSLVDDEEKKKEIRNSISETIGNSCFKTHIWPKNPREIEDDEKLRLAILSTDNPFGSQGQDPMEIADELWRNYKDEFRTYRNTVLFLACTEEEITDLFESVTTLRAIRHILEESSSILGDLTDEQIEDLEERLTKYRNKIIEGIRKAYTEIIVPSKDGLEKISLGNRTSLHKKKIDERIEDKLVEKDKLLRALEPELLYQDKWDIWPKKDSEGKKIKEDYISTKQLMDYFLKLPRLPILESEEVIKNCIKKGVDEKGFFGYVKLDEKKYDKETLKYEESLSSVEISDKVALLGEAKAKELSKEISEGSEVEKEITFVDERGKEVKDKEKAEKIKTKKKKGSKVIETDLKDIEEEEKEPGEIKEFEIIAHPKWEDQWRDTYSATISPLTQTLQKDIDIELKVKIKVSSQEGISKTEIERYIEDNLKQRDIMYEILYQD